MCRYSSYRSQSRRMHEFRVVLTYERMSCSALDDSSEHFALCAAEVGLWLPRWRDAVCRCKSTSRGDLPLVFLLLQLLIAVVLLHISALVSKRVEIPRINIEGAKKLFPVVFVNIAGLAFNILCLRGVEASYFQIARGLVLPLTILVSWLHNRASPVSSSVLGASAIVTTGFFIGVVPNNDLPASATPSLLSLVYGFLSSLFIAVHAVLIKTSLPYCDNSTIQLAYWTNAGSAVLLLPVVLVAGELSVLYNKMGDAQWNSTVFLWGSSVTGIFGFLLCIAGLLSIRVTSPVTHMISSAARSVLQTLIGVMYFGDIITTNRATSISVILGGSMLYTWIKSVEARPQQQPVDIEAQDLDFAKTNAEIERLMSEREEKD